MTMSKEIFLRQIIAATPPAADFRAAARCLRWVYRALLTVPWWQRWLVYSQSQYSNLATAFETIAASVEENADSLAELRSDKPAKVAGKGGQ